MSDKPKAADAAKADAKKPAVQSGAKTDARPRMLDASSTRRTDSRPPLPRAGK